VKKYFEKITIPNTQFRCETSVNRSEEMPVTDPDAIPFYTAHAGRGLSEAMLADYRSAGVLVLEDFVPGDACRRLRERALELMDEFDPESVRHVFSTTKQTQLDDSYFYESGDKIRFFWKTTHSTSPGSCGSRNTTA